jgi:hypothetical protein
MRSYIDDYTALASIYAVVSKAHTKQVYVDKASQDLRTHRLWVIVAD